MRPESDTKIIGRKFPQLNSISGGNYKEPLSLINLSDDTPLKETITVYQLDKSAKLTDVLSFGKASYYILNNKTRESFNKFNIRDTYFIPIKVIEPSNSTWFAIYFPYTNDSIELINYDETIFFITDALGEQNFGEFIIGNHMFNKVEMWRKEYNKIHDGKEIKIKKLVLKTQFQHVDLFYLSPFYNNAIVSERIKLEIEKQKIVGLKFRQINLSFE